MDRGLVISGAGHLGLILWVFLGDWLFMPAEAPVVQVAEVSIISTAEYDAMVSEAPAAPTEAPDQATPPPTPEARPETPPPQTEAPTETQPPEPAPADQPDAVADAPEDVPISDTPQPDSVPETPAPIGAEDQPIPVPNSDVAPAPKPIDRVEATPVDPTRDAPEVADEATPEQSDAQTPDAQPVEVQPDAAPEAATTQIVTEATDTAEDAPQLAPMSSKKPQSRPKAPAETPPEETQVAEAKPAEEPKPDTQDAVADAVAAAVADAPAEPAPDANSQTSETGGVGDAPKGPPMTAGEKDALRVAVSKCWSLGAISTEAMQTIVTLRLSLGEDGKPDSGSITLTDFSGGSEASANQMYEVARRAIIRCGKNGFPLPRDKFDQWKDLELVFDPNGMRLR